MLSRLIPRDEEFFDLFNQLAEYLHAAAKLLDQLFAEPHRTADLVKQIKDAGSDGPECSADFAEGYREGVHASFHTGSACFLVGYNAGLAALHVGAREGRGDLVSGECIEQYRYGKTQGAAAQIAEDLDDPVLRACFRTGYDDGQLLRGQS